MTRTPEPNLLMYGDNLEMLSRYVEDESVDLVYLDPPFNSKASYNVLFQEQDGSRAAAQIKAFNDTWRWDQASSAAYDDVVENGPEQVSKVMQAFRTAVGPSDMLAYLSMMAPRLVELKRVLKPSGSIYLHCDTAASHYLKILMDAVFDPRNFRNEIIWRRTGSNSARKRYGPLHQSILYYVKSKSAPFYPLAAPYTNGYVKDYFDQSDERGRYRPVLLTGPGSRTGESGKKWRRYDPSSVGRHWQPSSYVYTKYREVTGEDLADYPLLERLDKLDDVGLLHWGKTGDVPNYKYYLADAPGVLLQDMWGYQPGTEGCVYGRPGEGIDQDVKWLSTKDKERLGYPTQKPEGILERIIRCSSREGDLVLDPFCGCGTTVAVAQRLKRRWIGIDITFAATNLIKTRLFDAFQDEAKYKVIGEPVSVPDAAVLAEQDAYQFQWWALGLVGARPIEKKRGADRGIDGRLYFHDVPGERTKQIIFSVKGGHTDVKDVRDLVGVLDREKADIGVLISLQRPTRPMRTEAASAGFYEQSAGTHFHSKHPRLQLLTIDQLLDGRTVDMPVARRKTFKEAPRAKAEPFPTEALPLSGLPGAASEPELEEVDPDLVPDPDLDPDPDLLPEDADEADQEE